jgi:LmbE family N-acetylglucosaminyl deacetylase
MLDYSEEGLAAVDFDDLVGRIVEPIRMHRPEVILTFGPDGITGDADHVVIGRAAEAAFRLAGEPLSHEDDLEEDQVAWRAAKLYHLVVAAGDLEPLGAAAPAEYGSAAAGGSVALELGELTGVKLAAISRHVSQTGSAGPFREWPPEARDRFLGVERYRLARSNLPVGAVAEAGLWDGLA